MKTCAVELSILLSLVISQCADAFGVRASRPQQFLTPSLSSTALRSTSSQTSSASPKAKPRAGVAQGLLNFVLQTPLWKLLLVPQARNNIIKTAEANGIQWDRALSWIKKQEGAWQSSASIEKDMDFLIPDYYRKEFHAYESGNLQWDAAFEQEIASRAVGARNFPDYGSEGEEAFRGCFDKAIETIGGRIPANSVVLDMGCGTGTSTRRIASAFPDAKRIIGIDMSPYFIEVGQTLLKLSPKGQKDGGDWVTTIHPDDRIELRLSQAEKTDFDDESIDVVNLGLVIHELPIDATINICKEALRVLKPDGQLWISEMDYDSPAFAEQRENALLFSLIRSTEPYLDVYADGVDEVRDFLVNNFSTVKITAATGRHYALVATKAKTSIKDEGERALQDSRFDSQGNYIVDDTHLKTWESSS